MAGHHSLDAKSSLVWNQGGRQAKGCLSYGTALFHLLHTLQLTLVVNIVTAPRENHHSFESHPGRYFTLAFVSSISIVCSGLRLLLHDILTGLLLDIVSTMQDITMANLLVFYSTTLVGDKSLLCPLAILYLAASQHLFRSLLRFIAVTRWDPFANWDPLYISSARILLGTLDPKFAVEQALYCYVTAIVWITALLVGPAYILVGSEEWVDVSSQAHFGIDLFQKSRMVIGAWACINLTMCYFLSSLTSRIPVFGIYPTSIPHASISLYFPRLRHFCSSIDFVASLSMFALAASNLVSLFRTEPILNSLFRGHMSWVQVAFWARQLTAVAATFFIGLTFLVIIRQRSLLCSMMVVEKLTSNIVDNINGPKGMEFLVLRKPNWTDDEVVALLRLRGLTEKGRDKVACFLYHEGFGEDDEQQLSLDCFKYNPRGSIEFCGENMGTPPYNSEGSDLELGLGPA